MSIEDTDSFITFPEEEAVWLSQLYALCEEQSGVTHGLVNHPKHVMMWLRFCWAELLELRQENEKLEMEE